MDANKNTEGGVCPVDHSTREAWIKNANKGQQSLLEDKIKPVPNTATSVNNADDQPKCPVDHSAKTAWMFNGGENQDTSVSGSDDNCSSDRMGNGSNSASFSDSNSANLPNEREISSIPRSSTGSNWVYPSQQQFYNAMRRKNWDPKADDMKTVVPIHNAVNERAWMEILKWEHNEGGDKCGGPQLVKFQGDSKKISPKARFNMMFGYQKPFDRHDWLVDRCGTQVEYILDFYSGKPNPLMPDLPSFYIDVRPKLNTFEGCRLRLFKFLGFKN